MSNKIPQVTLLKLAKRDNVECIFCNEGNVNKITIDHVFPKRLGGTNKLSNLAFCCKSCNEKKGGLLLDQFLRAFEIPVTLKIARYF